MIEIKTPSEIERMRQAGKIVAGLLQYLAALIRPGVKAKELDKEAHSYLKTAGAKPAFLGYRGFPATICVSINDEVVHGIPGEQVFMDGDLVSIDAGGIIEGMYADSARTFAVGDVSKQAEELMAVTQQALDCGIEQAVIGNRLSDISHAVQKHIEAHNCGIVKDFVGHGIGRALHEDPAIPNFGPPHTGPRLRAGMVFAIEPMVTLGDAAVRVMNDGWTVKTNDRSLAAHFEDTVAITEQGPDILTRLPEHSNA
jgi:methionyl aminopeptidase